MWYRAKCDQLSVCPGNRLGLDNKRGGIFGGELKKNPVRMERLVAAHTDCTSQMESGELMTLPLTRDN